MAKEKSLAEKVLDLEIVVLNGANYICKVEPKENGYTLKEAVEVASDFETTIKNWIKANNSNNLQELSCEGDGVLLVRKGFTEPQKLEVMIIGAKAEYAIKNAVTELQNSKV